MQHTLSFFLMTPDATSFLVPATEAHDEVERETIELAKELDLPVMIHTPHRDKKQGTTRSMDVIIEHGIAPSRVVIDHNNEETVAETLQRGFWAGFSIYPSTKMGNARMVELLKQYGGERVIVDSACDWGISDCLGVAKTAKLALAAAAEAQRLAPQASVVAVMQLTPTTCRWPMWDAGEPYLFCGAKAPPEHPYCPVHHERAHDRIVERWRGPRA